MNYKDSLVIQDYALTYNKNFCYFMTLLHYFIVAAVPEVLGCTPPGVGS